MNRTLPLTLCQLYVLLLLLGTSVISEPPRFLPTLVLLVLVLATTLKPLPPRLEIVICTAVILMTPMALTLPLENRLVIPETGIHLISVATILPVLYLLDRSLRQHTLNTRLEIKKKPGLYLSGTLISLAIPPIVAMFLAVVIGNRTLLFTGVAFLIFLGSTTLYVILTIHRSPLSAPTTSVRIIAGNSGDMSLGITNNASTPIHCQFGTPEPWLEIMPLAAILKKGRIRLNLSYTPPLAGNSRPQLYLIVKDLRGLVQIYQVLEPLVFEIIPRARYAEWLARKYLQRAGGGAGGAGMVPREETASALTRGIEYLESRDYQPGDSMKDIDWKHSLRLNQLIVKDYSPDEDMAIIIAVNLSVGNEEEADNLAYNLVTAALTLARDNIPSALAAYDHRDVVLSTEVNEPNETLRHTLSLIKDINHVKSIPRHLELADIGLIRRNIAQLQQLSTNPARRLLEIMNFEFHSIEESTRNHPATLAISNTAKHVTSSGTILLISQLNHDAEAIKIITSKLTKRAFKTVPVAAPLKVIPR
jgi:hypothetical protein